MRFDANFLVVRVRPPGWRLGLIVPVPLFVLEEALDAAALLVRIWLWLGKGRRKSSVRVLGLTGTAVLADVVGIPAAFVRGLRSQGKFTIAEVRDDNTHVSVRVV